MLDVCLPTALHRSFRKKVPHLHRAGQNGPAEAPVTAVVNAGDCHGYLEAGSSDSWRQNRRWPGNLTGQMGDPAVEEMFCKGSDDLHVRGSFSRSARS